MRELGQAQTKPSTALPEEPFFFPGNGRRLFGVLHRPKGTESGVGIVLCHPFAEEKLWAHRVFVSLARDLAALGHAVLRFDAAGYGDSEGAFAEATLETQVRDSIAAIGQLKVQQPDLRTVGLIGLRLGAAVACMAGARCNDEVRFLILCEPVVNGPRYVQEILRASLASQLATHGRVVQNRSAMIEALNKGLAIQVEGYPVTAQLHGQLAAIDLFAPDTRFHGDVLVLQVDGRQTTVREELQQLASHLDGDVEAVAEDAFWKEIKRYYGRADHMTRAITTWLGQRYD